MRNETRCSMTGGERSGTTCRNSSRKGTWALHTHPDNGVYRDVLPGKFGEAMRLPEPLGVEIGTEDFPVYDPHPTRV
ncbi:hypothetical protein [Streptomyces sp. NPDC054837]